MNYNKEYELLKDLAKLLQKHGPESFKSLALLFSDKELAETISNILFEVHHHSELIKKTQKKLSKNKTLRSSIIELNKDDPERTNLLLSIYDKLEENKYLPTLKQIRLFCEDNALKPISARSRKSAINQFVKVMMELSSSDISSVKKLLDEKPEDRTLDGWSSIILNRKEDKMPNQTLKADK